MLTEFKIASLNVGIPEDYTYEGKVVSSAIYKKPIDHSVYLTALNFEGDRQADLIHHGGPDKAINAYVYEHYAYWEAHLERKLAPAAFGENLTLCGAFETDICIGDKYQLGEAIVQVSQPRMPCFKLAMKHGVPDLAAQVVKSGYTGFYLRVLKEGQVHPADSLQLLEKHPAGVTLALVNEVTYNKTNPDPEALNRVAAVNELAAGWRESLKKRLLKHE